MKRLFLASIAVVALSSILAACSSTGNPEFRAVDYGPGIEPIRGSLTYGGQPTPRRNMMPGNTFSHEFYNDFGYRVSERYRVLEDGQLDIYSRRVTSISVGGGG